MTMAVMLKPDEPKAAHPEASALDPWFRHEVRIGRKQTVSRLWAERGQRATTKQGLCIGYAYRLGNGTDPRSRHPAQPIPRGVGTGARIRIHFASACPDDTLFRMLAGRLATAGPQITGQPAPSSPRPSTPNAYHVPSRNQTP